MPPGPLPTCRQTLDPEALEAELERVTGAELQPAQVRLYPDGAEALDALRGLIDGAMCRIDVLMYLWDDDPIGWDVAKRLASRAGPDLPVRVLVDGGGNLLQGEPKTASAAEVNRVVCWLSRQPNVQFLRTRDPGLHFDHRKLVVADGRAAWSGGRNLTRRAFLEDHDLSYTVAGPLAAEADCVFETFWREQGGRAAGPSPPSPDPSFTANAGRVLWERGRSMRNWNEACITPWTPRATIFSWRIPTSPTAYWSPNWRRRGGAAWTCG